MRERAVGGKNQLYNNRPFPSSCLPPLQSESKCEVFFQKKKCEVFLMKISFHSYVK